MIRIKIMVNNGLTAAWQEKGKLQKKKENKI
jgi:hypothetical protein